ncbi:MAG: hypothetical protein ACI93N_001598, partial [Flavobacteriaceae bacterium]
DFPYLGTLKLYFLGNMNLTKVLVSINTYFFE